MEASAKRQMDQAARDYTELVFLYKRLGVATHIVGELSEVGKLTERGAVLYQYALTEQVRCTTKLAAFLGAVTDSGQ